MVARQISVLYHWLEVEVNRKECTCRCLITEFRLIQFNMLKMGIILLLLCLIVQQPYLRLFLGICLSVAESVKQNIK